MNLKSVILAKVLGLGIIAIMVSGIAVHPAFAATATSGTLYFTTFNGGTNVNKVSYTYDGVSTFTLGSVTNIASTGTADGLNFLPTGKLFVGGQGNAAHVVDVSAVNSFYSLTAGGTSCFHTTLIGSDEWCGGIPGNLAKFSSPYTTNGVALPIIGNEAGVGVDSLAAVPGGTIFYTSSDANGVGSFGTIDLSTGTTTRTISGLAGAHGMTYDSFSGDLILCGNNDILQINPAVPNAVAHTYTNALGGNFDQCTADGKGHLFAANNGGNLLFMDYSSSGTVDNVGNFVSAPFLAANLDDVAPIVGAGAPPPSHPVGGTIIPVDMTSLFVAGAMTNAFWILPTFGGIAGAAITLFKVKRKHN